LRFGRVMDNPIAVREDTRNNTIREIDT